MIGSGCTIGNDNDLMNGVKIFPGTTLPDGAIKF
jgi:acetyltransferase-like isoleucine patch superfamily enzyme